MIHPRSLCYNLQTCPAKKYTLHTLYITPTPAVLIKSRDLQQATPVTNVECYQLECSDFKYSTLELGDQLSVIC